MFLNKLFILAAVMLSTTGFAAMYGETGKGAADAPAGAFGQNQGNLFVDILVEPAKDKANAIEVIVMGSADFDVNKIDKSSIEFGDLKGKGDYIIKDRNNDGFADLIAVFSTDDLNLGNRSKALTLKGKTTDGQTFQGTGWVNISDVTSK